MIRHITDAQRRSRIGIRHDLGPGCQAQTAEQVVQDLVALHSSDPATVYLSLQPRMVSPSVDALDGALYERRTLVRHHAMRRTIWVFPVDTARDAHVSMTTAVAESETARFRSFLEANGVTEDGDAWIDAASERILAEVAERGVVTTREIGAALPDLAVTLEVQGATLSAHARTLLVMGFRGLVARTRPLGSWTSSQYRWATMDAWIPGGLGGGDVRAASARMVDRYLAAFGPATLEDIAWWTGWTKGTTRVALEDAAAPEVRTSTGSAWVAADDHGRDREPGPWVAMLPGLDPTTMGWKQRDWYLRKEDAALLFDRNGNAGPTVWMDGRIVGGWTQQASGTIAYRLLDDEARTRVPEVDAAAHALEAYYGDTRHKVRFPAPLQKTLA
jgi:hypothetical protein